MTIQEFTCPLFTSLDSSPAALLIIVYFISFTKESTALIRFLQQFQQLVPVNLQ